MNWWSSLKVTSKSESPSGSNLGRSTSSWKGRRHEIGECPFILWTYLAAMSDRLEAPVWTFDHHFDVLRLTFGDDRGSGFPAESQIDLPEDSKNTTADFSVIDQYRMVGTDGSTEKSTRPIVHAWCVRVNINATRYSLVIPSALLQPWLRTS